MNSHYVLFELGARWGAKKPLFPLITDNKGVSILKGPLQGINALVAHEEGQLFQFVADIGKELGIVPEGPNSYHGQMKQFIKSLANTGANEKPVKAQSSQPQKESNSEEYSGANEQIKEHCKQEWPDDFHMRAHCIAEQSKALLILQQGRPSDIEEDDFVTIRKKAARDWPSDFHMRAHQEKEQFEALRRLKDL
ncbi:hypothetical protein [Hymenobacter wooponensis]|uniref:Uncharacterized protein n=1 Tax=Hymenobacter wooponensis TaxID=1525360 RepID=A0A4Z0MNC4_9BACT|nr:hypothetical protein [Hymenobacter wooponensis]TGD80757.1 hypothetical protein EU557_13170 [Hymenobacter wooponensis]